MTEPDRRAAPRPPAPRSSSGAVAFCAPDRLVLRGEVDLEVMRRTRVTEDELAAVRTVDAAGAVLRSSTVVVLLLLCVRHCAAQEPSARLRLVGASPRLADTLEDLGVVALVDLDDGPAREPVAPGGAQTTPYSLSPASPSPGTM